MAHLKKILLWCLRILSYLSIQNWIITLSIFFRRTCVQLKVNGNIISFFFLINDDCFVLSFFLVCFFFFREMFIQLQHENKMLLLQQEGSENERIMELQKQLEQKQWTVNELETEKRWWVKQHLKYSKMRFLVLQSGRHL